MEETIKGSQSLIFRNAPYLISAASVTGSKEAEGPLGKLFDMTSEDDLFGAQTWEEAESTMQKEACVLALGKAHVEPAAVRLSVRRRPAETGDCHFHGLWRGFRSRCSGCMGRAPRPGKRSPLAAMSAAAGYGEYMLAVTSSHFGRCGERVPFPPGIREPETAVRTLDRDRERRVPCRLCGKTARGTDRINTKTARYAREKSHVRISGVTVGKIVDYGLKDSQNMGACMAPAAMDTIVRNFEDMGRTEQDYDRIITGDLGYVGQSILFDLVRGKGYDIRERHLDCGMTIFDQQTQDTHAGGSGCGCAAVTLASFVLPKIEKGEWKRVLFVPTGALMSTVSFNEGASVPGIAHGDRAGALLAYHFADNCARPPAGFPASGQR